jgi:hypothetical protein
MAATYPPGPPENDDAIVGHPPNPVGDQPHQTAAYPVAEIEAMQHRRAMVAASGADISPIASADTSGLLLTIAATRPPTVQTIRKTSTTNTDGVLLE